jgi:type I restriction enzyme R subunit
MRKIFPNACYRGFTVTPIFRAEKNTVAKFGGMIDVYAIDQAVKDKAPPKGRRRLARTKRWRPT